MKPLKTALMIFALGMPCAALPQEGGPALVKIAIAAVKDIAPVTLVPGTVVSRNDARLSAEVEGRLLEVADVGSRVKEGDAVARIEDKGLRLQKRELEAEVMRAEARLQFLESEEKRFQRLTESNLAALAQLEETRSDRDVARGDLSVARARLEQIIDKLDRTVMTAPFGGMVVERLMTPGERVTEGSSVVRLVDQQHLEVIARAPLEYYRYVEAGEMLPLRAGTETAMGEVRRVIAVGDENTHQFELRLDLPGSPFPVGRTVRVAIPTSDARDTLTVPRDALVLRPDGQSVFVVEEDDTAREVPVTIGVGQGDYIEVIGAVSPGDRVVIRGNERLQSGQPVKIMES